MNETTWGPSEDDLRLQEILNTAGARLGKTSVDLPFGIEHRDGIEWADERVHLRGWRGRWPFHWRHRAQTRASDEWGPVERCRCGAIRSGDRFWINLDNTWLKAMGL
jgi:hypothetical protein